jgi:hypothetical protein
VHYNAGASAIYAVTRDFHALVEWVGYWTEFGEPGMPKQYEFSSLISPGVRKAFNFGGETQMVLGAAVPVGLTRSAPDIGVFLYLSFEHSFLKHTD